MAAYAGEEVGKREHSSIAAGSANRRAHVGINVAVPQKGLTAHLCHVTHKGGLSDQVDCMPCSPKTGEADAGEM